MKLYYVVGSPNCRKVHAVVNHLALEVQFEYLDFMQGELRSPGYLAINPNGLVPTLRDGELTLWESNAIMQYLADAVPGNTLLPAERRLRAQILKWQCWELAHFNKAFGVLSFETAIKPMLTKAAPDPVRVQWAQAELARFAPVLDRALQGREYLVGNDVTLADYSMIHLEGSKEAVPFDWSTYDNLNAYFERMRAIPHWASTAASPQALGRRPASAL